MSEKKSKSVEHFSPLAEYVYDYQTKKTKEGKANAWSNGMQAIRKQRTLQSALHRQAVDESMHQLAKWITPLTDLVCNYVQRTCPQCDAVCPDTCVACDLVLDDARLVAEMCTGGTHDVRTCQRCGVLWCDQCAPVVSREVCDACHGYFQTHSALYDSAWDCLCAGPNDLKTSTRLCLACYLHEAERFCPRLPDSCCDEPQRLKIRLRRMYAAWYGLLSKRAV